MHTMIQAVRKKWLYAIIWIMGYIPMSFLVGAYGRKYLPRKVSSVIVSNHETLMDSPMMCMLVPLRQHLRWIGKDSIRSVQAVKEEFGELGKPMTIKERVYSMLRDGGRAIIFFVARNTGTIIVKKGKSTVSRAVEVLRKNKDVVVGVFPTGARRHIEPGAKPRSGFVVMARRARVPVVPVAFHRTSMFRWQMRIFPPIPYKELRTHKYGKTDQERAGNIMAMIENHIQKSSLTS